MSNLMNYRILVLLSFFLIAPQLMQAQTDKKAIELKRLETGIATAKAKVALNERHLTIADSLITLGSQQVAESKTETKAIEGDRKKLDKDNVTQKKPLTKLTTSKDREEANQARADLKALDVKYKLDSKALGVRLKDATKKMSTGNANLTRGKATKKSAHDALKISQTALDGAQARYDAASGVNATAKGKKKK